MERWISDLSHFYVVDILLLAANSIFLFVEWKLFLNVINLKIKFSESSSLFITIRARKCSFTKIINHFLRERWKI